MGVVWGRGKWSAFLSFHRFSNALFAESSNFFQAANRSLSGEKNCIVYSLFGIFIIIIIVISSSSISFVVLLNCISTHEFSLLSVSLALSAGGREGMSEQLSSA